MVSLYHTDHRRADLVERCGAVTQFGGVRQVTVAEGAGRGVRLLEFETGSGLRFDVAVDRAMDISSLSHAGRAIGWQGPAGLRHPSLTDTDGEDGLGWNRSFSGFLATGGLDHILGPESVPAEIYDYPRKARVPHGLHGRIANTPARLTGYGERWGADRCVLWAEGVIVQATLFGEALHLERRIEADLGGDTVRLVDRVVNAGFARTPHMMMYHIILGYPLIDDGARFLAPIREVVFATHADDLAAQGVGYRCCPPPRRRFGEQVWEHDMAGDPHGEVPMAVVNDVRGFGLLVVTRKDQMPCAFQWQNFRSGNYVMALEPATHHLPGDLFARGRDEMIWLEAGEDRLYSTSFSVLDGTGIAAAEARIGAIAAQPDQDYPQPSGQFASLYGAKEPA